MAVSPPKKLKSTHIWRDTDKTNSFANAFHAADELGEDERHENDTKKPTAVFPRVTQSHRQRSDEQVILFSSTRQDSDVFSPRVQEMLHSVALSHNQRIAEVDTTLRRLKSIIDNLPERSPTPAADAENELSKDGDVRIPFPKPLPDNDAKHTFTYAKPANINVVGSYDRKTAVPVNDQLTVDLAVTMPTKIFQDKDYLNYRYFYKRAYYLARIAVGIKTFKDTDFHLEYTLQDDNHLQPVIMVTPKQDGDGSDLLRSRYRIRILLAVDSKLFPLTKTLPNKSCLRLYRTSQLHPIAPTPFYNASIRAECCSLSSTMLLRDASFRSMGFKDACILGSVWLRQRGFGTGLTCGGFGHFEWACTIALLLQGGGPQNKPILSERYGSHQLFTKTLLYLSTKDLVHTPMVIGDGRVEAFAHDCPILLDGARGLNILYKMTPWSYAMLRHEASGTSQSLNGANTDSFEACFNTRLSDPMRRFDCGATFHAGPYLTSPPNLDAYDDLTHICVVAYRALRKGLDDRASLINLQTTAPTPWAITATKEKAIQKGIVLIGLSLDTKHVNRLVDQGPAAKDKQASSSFRQFWGEMAELRRFKDGSIRESIIWSASSNQTVIEQLLAYVLRRHVGHEAADSLSMLGRTFDRILPLKEITDSVSSYQPTMNAYEVFEKQIRALEGLPLQIRHIFVADAQLRYASLSIPYLNPIRIQKIEPIRVYVQFEGSSRWPDDLNAIHQTKIAFLLKLGEALESSAPEPSVFTHLGLESQTNRTLSVAFLDISYSSGAVFRVQIHHERELTLLERAVKFATSGTSKESAASILSVHKRKYIQLPVHTQAVRSLSSRYPCLSPCIRLMKEWRNSQLLSCHVNDEVVELLTIRSFVQPYPWAVPGSAVTGFLRTLTFIADWDWRYDPLVLDFSGEMKSTTYDKIITRFKAWRRIDPAMNRVAMFVASDQDQEGILSTEAGPSKIVAARLTSLARAACAVVDKQGIDLQAPELFTPHTADYDFIVHLNPMFLEGAFGIKEQKKAGYKNLQSEKQPNKSNKKVVPSFLDELRTLCGNNVIFFHNENGGSLIGGVWNPLTGPRSWRINIGYSTVPTSHDGETSQVILNRNVTLHNVARLGGDLILQIEERQ